MNSIEPRHTVRIVSITDTRTWWQKSVLSRISPRLTLAMTLYGAAVGAFLGMLHNG